MKRQKTMSLDEIRSLSRRIHMDFHTPAIDWNRAMKEFDVKDYVKILKDAHLNSLVSFTKCHHGYSYYKTDLGVRHPSLPKDLDMFGEILDECHKNDMKVIAYYSVGWLSSVQMNHPEWMERNLKGETINTIGVPTKGPWANICLNSPYVTEVVLPELREIFTKYDADGVWIDIIECNPCHCEYCKEKYRKQFGKEMPDNDIELDEFVTQTKYEFIDKCEQLIHSINPEVAFTYNTAGRNRELVELVDYCSIETHPGAPGDKDAWTRALLTYKFLQKYNKAWESCTSRFIHGWGGWDEQPLENMLAVGSRILAHGGMINLGDQAYPNGTLDKELYKNIGKYFEFMSAREERAYGGKPVPCVAVLTKPFDIYAAENNVYFGVTKILTQNHIVFDIIDESMVDDFKSYECIVLPELAELNDETVAALKAYTYNGGKILATGNTSLKDGIFQLEDVFGCQYVKESPYSITYFKLHDEIADGVRRSPIMVPGRLSEVKLHDGAQVLSDVYDPVIEPDYDNFMIFRNRYYSPAGDKSKNPGIVKNTYGKGEAVYIAGPVFEVFQTDEQWYLCDVIRNVMEVLYNERIIRVEAPRTLEVNVTEKDDEIICHLIQYQTQNEACNVREIVPVHNVNLKVSLDVVSKDDVIEIPSGNVLKTKVSGKMLEVTVPEVSIYSQIVFKKSYI